PENLNKIILEEYMGLSLDKYTLIFDETEFEAAKNQFGGLGDGQSVIFELKTGFLDLETGERSTMAKVIYTFTKDLSLNEKFGA
ncbi:MAG: hypothetical protein IKI91_03945, partial [Clostridia bacterium]|nr:hypothetical protein [Clostridia bacterium]